MSIPSPNEISAQQASSSSYTTRVRLPTSALRRGIANQQRNGQHIGNNSVIQEIDVQVPLRRYNETSADRFSRALHRIQNIQHSLENTTLLDDHDVPPLVQQQQNSFPRHQIMRSANPRPVSQQTNSTASSGTTATTATTIAAEPTLMQVKPVFELTCKHCFTLVCTRGMKAILLADTSIELYSTDCPAQSIQILEKDYLARSCHCRMRDVACLQCGNVVGYHVISPCTHCLEASNNGHFWMFHSNACQPAQRHDKHKRIVIWNNLPRAELDQDFIRGNRYSYNQICR